MRAYHILLILLFSSCMIGCKTEPYQQDKVENPDSEMPSNEEDIAPKVIHGICRQNLQWVLPNLEVEEIADNIAAAHIPLVRLSGVKEGGSIEQVIQNIKTFSDRNVKVLVVLTLWKGLFPEGYELAPGPNYKLYKMSDIDMDLYTAFTNRFLEAVAREVDEGVVVGFELFNEVNWGDFNGDLQPTPEGKGQVFTLNTSLDDPAFGDVRDGIIKYGKCLEITRSTLDAHFPGKRMKLITNGMVVGAAWNNYAWSVNNGFSYVSPDLFLSLLQGTHPEQDDKTDYLQYADAIGLHSYPPLDRDIAELLRDYYFSPINAILKKPMPYWMTEWGFVRGQFASMGGEEKRLEYMLKFVEAIESTGNVEMTTLYEFDATNNYNIWENGALLESGKLFERINLNEGVL